MSKPDLPPNFETPFFLVCEVPDSLHAWLSNKGNVKPRINEDGKTIAVSFEPFDFDASTIPPMNGWPVYEIHPTDVAAVTNFFINYYDGLFDTLSKYRELAKLPEPKPLDALMSERIVVKPPFEIEMPPEVTPVTANPYMDYHLAFLASTIPAQTPVLDKLPAPPPAPIYPHIGERFGLLHTGELGNVPEEQK